MKAKIFMSLATIAILATLWIAAPARADNTRIYFTGIETGCDGWVVSREWESGPNSHYRIETQTCYDIASVPQFTGTNYPYDGVINVVGGGEVVTITGKFRFESDEGGTWVGNFIFHAKANTLTGVGHGEGMYEGQNIHISTDSNTGEFWGYIDTHE